MAETRTWELQDLLDSLHAAKASPGDNEFGTVSELGFLNLADYDYEADQWYLTPAGTALLALLEVEHCKRRIEAVGWYWNAYKAVSEGVYISHPAETDSELFDCEVHGTNYWHAAAEYAEMQAARKEGH